MEHPPGEKVIEVKENKKRDVNPIRGTQVLVDPERGPKNKRKKFSLPRR